MEKRTDFYDFIDKIQRQDKYIEYIEEENQKLKLHIEAKDKAYTALLKDYEELKEDRDKMKKRVKEHIIYSIKAEFIKKFWE